jgi:NADH dehydrogenase
MQIYLSLKLFTAAALHYYPPRDYQIQLMSDPSGLVLVTGAAGFVGSAITGRLHEKGWNIRALANRRRPQSDTGVTWISGGLFDNAALNSAMAGARAVIHLVGIIREVPNQGITFQKIHVEGTRAVIDAARRNGVRRFIQMSALGSRPDSESEYHRTKSEAENLTRASGLDWTIIQPSLIHGPGGEFTEMEFGWARGKAAPFLFMPYFGAGVFGTGGAGKIQPVFVGDVARAFVEAIDNDRTIGKSYPMGGADQITWPQMHRIVSQALLGRKRATMGIPVWYARMLTHLVPASMLPFNRDQIEMSREDNTCDMKPFVDDFGWMPDGFAASLNQYVAAAR